MTTVYALYIFIYGQKRILGIFSTRDKAERRAAEHGSMHGIPVGDYAIYGEVLDLPFLAEGN
jgi:hypothetical protein